MGLLLFLQRLLLAGYLFLLRAGPRGLFLLAQGGQFLQHGLTGAGKGDLPFLHDDDVVHDIEDAGLVGDQHHSGLALPEVQHGAGQLLFAFLSEGATAGLFKGSNAGTDSATTIHMGLGNDVIALNAADGKDTLVLNGAFDHDVVMNFTTAKDQINVKNFTASHVDTITGEGIDVTAANFGLNGTAISATAGKSLLVLKNTATAENDYWFFEVNSSTGGHLAAEDKITLLGSITLGDGDTLDAADIHLV